MDNSLCTAFLKFLAFAALAVTTTAPGQTNNLADEVASGWTYPVIKDYGPTWPLPRAAKLATSAGIVLVAYQNDGYALMPF